MVVAGSEGGIEYGLDDHPTHTDCVSELLLRIRTNEPD